MSKPTEAPSHIAAQVIAARIDAGLSCEQLATLAGVSRKTIYNLEGSGRCTIATLESIALALKMPIVIMPWAVEWRHD